MNRSGLLISPVLIALAGCSGGDSSSATPVITAPTPTPTPTPSPSPTPTPAPTPVASFSSPLSSGEDALGNLDGTIADPDGNGTVAGLNINGNEVATLTINGGLTETFANDPVVPFQAPQTYVGADGTKRVIPVSVLSNGGRTRTADQIDIFGAEQGVPAPGQTSTNTPVKNIYLIEYTSSPGSLGNQHTFSIMGDPTLATTRPTSGSYSYTGEAVGYVYDYGDGTGLSTQFIGPVTITVDYGVASGGVQGHMTISQFQTLTDTSKPFTIDLVADALTNGVLQSKSVALTGLNQPSPIPGALQGQAYGVGALEIGGVFHFKSGSRTISGSFVAAR